jgi:anti-sigma B factor antagonist
MQSTLAQSQMKVIQPCGHINASNAADLQDQLTSTVSSRQYASLLVDMSQVESLDSAGLMALVSTLTLSQQLNQRFGLCHVSPSIRIIFELTQLDRAFEIFESRAAFVAAIA